MTGKEPLPAAIYCRISLSRFGDTTKVDDQELICRRLAKQLGWDVRHVLKDNSLSAWKRNRKRPGWDELLSIVEQGAVRGILVFHGDRLIRQPWDLELLLKLADERGIRLASPTGSRDLGNPDDRYILRIEAAHAVREVDNTSRRLKRHFERQAAKGKVRTGGRGGRAFGYQPDGLTVVPEEAAAIREAAQRVLTGEGVGVICRSFNERGILTSAGNQWDHGALKKLLMRARLAGLVERHGVIITEQDENGATVPVRAAWPPILDGDTWEAVRAVLQGKAAQFAYTTNARRYLLSGIALCGTCGAPLAIRHNTREESLRGYGCISRDCPKKVHRSVRHMDSYVGAFVVQRLADKELRQLLAAPADHTLAAELAAVTAQREAAMVEFADDPEMGADVLRITVRRLDQRIAALRARIAEAATGHALDGLLGISRAEWEALDLSRRRSAVAKLVRVTVHASVKRGRGFDASTVQLERLL